MPELVELARIHGVKGYRARQLFNAGLRTIQAVAESDPSTLEAIFNRGEVSLRILQRKIKIDCRHMLPRPHETSRSCFDAWK